MRLLTPTLILATFIAVGLFADRLITAHALAHGTAEVTIRLAAAMTGLFVGGIAATLLALALLLRRPSSDKTHHTT